MKTLVRIAFRGILTRLPLIRGSPGNLVFA
jgi:hypothetical protein